MWRAGQPGRSTRLAMSRPAPWLPACMSVFSYCVAVRSGGFACSAGQAQQNLAPINFLLVTRCFPGLVSVIRCPAKEPVNRIFVVPLRRCGLLLPVLPNRGHGAGPARCAGANMTAGVVTDDYFLLLFALLMRSCCMLFMQCRHAFLAVCYCDRCCHCWALAMVCSVVTVRL